MTTAKEEEEEEKEKRLVLLIIRELLNLQPNQQAQVKTTLGRLNLFLSRSGNPCTLPPALINSLVVSFCSCLQHLPTLNDSIKLLLLDCLNAQVDSFPALYARKETFTTVFTFLCFSLTKLKSEWRSKADLTISLLDSIRNLFPLSLAKEFSLPSLLLFDDLEYVNREERLDLTKYIQSDEFRLPGAQLLSVLLEMVRDTDLPHQLRFDCLKSLHLLLIGNIRSPDQIVNFLPGVVTVLTSLLSTRTCSDRSSLLIAGIRCLQDTVILVFSDLTLPPPDIPSTLSESIERFSSQSHRPIPLTSATARPSISRSDLGWLRENLTRIEPLLQKVFLYNQTNSSEKVRLANIHFVHQLLTKCFGVFTLPYLLEVLFISLHDENLEVAKISRDLTHSLVLDEHSLVQRACDCIKALPSTLSSPTISESMKRHAMYKVAGYVDFFNAKGQANEIKLLELALDFIKDSFKDIIKLSNPASPPSSSTAAITTIVKDDVYDLVAMIKLERIEEKSTILSLYFLLQSIFALNHSRFLDMAISDLNTDQPFTGLFMVNAFLKCKVMQPLFGMEKEIQPFLLQQCLNDQVLQLPTTRTEQLRLYNSKLLQLPKGFSLDPNLPGQTTQCVCLMLDNLLLLARMLGQELEPHLPDLLYVMLEKLMDSNPLVQTVAKASISELAKIVGFETPRELLASCVDVVADRVSLQLRNISFYPNTLKVFRAMFRFAAFGEDLSLLPLIDDAIEEILEAMENYSLTTMPNNNKKSTDLEKFLTLVDPEKVEEKWQIVEDLMLSLEAVCRAYQPPRREISSIADISSEVEVMGVCPELQLVLDDFIKQKEELAKERESNSIEEIEDYFLNHHHHHHHHHDDDCNGQNHHENQLEEDTKEEENTSMEQAYALRILDGVQHHLTCPYLSVVKSALRCIRYCSTILAGHSKFPPFAHNVWATMLSLFKEPQLRVPCLEALNSMMEAAPEFLQRRLIKEAWPKVSSIFKQLSLVKTLYSADRILLQACLDFTASLVSLVKLDEEMELEIAQLVCEWLGENEQVVVVLSALTNKDVAWLTLMTLVPSDLAVIIGRRESRAKKLISLF